MASIASLTSRGRVTIPKAIRDALGVTSGTLITLTPMPGGTVAIRVKGKGIAEPVGRTDDSKAKKE